METAVTPPTNRPRLKSPPADRARFFYPAVAGALLILMLLGFQQFYLQGKAAGGRELPPPIRSLIILHGLSMTGWVLLYLTESVLVATRRYRWHMLLGRVGAVLAVAIVLTGLKVGIESARFTPPEVRIWGRTPRQFMTIPVLSILVFGGFVAVGVAYRKRPGVHKPMMLLATLSAIPAAVSRIDALSNLYHGTVCETVFGPNFMTLVFAGLLPFVYRLLTRTVDRVYLGGYAFLVTVSVFTYWVGTTGAWDRVAGVLLG